MKTCKKDYPKGWKPGDDHSLIVIRTRAMFLCLWMLSHISMGQTIAFPEQEARWNYLSASEAPPYYTNHTFIYVSDTALCGLSYAHITYSFGHSPGSDRILLRDSSGRIFYKHYDHCDSADFLAYDFTLQTGDRFAYIPTERYHITPRTYDTLIVDSITNVTYSDNIVRKIWHLHKLDSNQVLASKPIQWIEGIGSAQLLHNFIPCQWSSSVPPCDHELTCYGNENAEIIATDICRELTGVSGQAAEPGWIVYPNPSSGVFHIKGLNITTEAYSIHCYDPLGNIVPLDPAGGPESGFIIRQAGIYFLMVQEKTGVSYTGKVVIE